MNNSSNQRRLLCLGGTLLVVISCGSQCRASPLSPRLRRQKRRNAIAVGGIDESIHEANAVQYDETVDAPSEEASTRVPDSATFSGRNSYGYYYQDPYGNTSGGHYSDPYGGNPYGGNYGNPYWNPYDNTQYYYYYSTFPPTSMGTNNNGIYDNGTDDYATGDPNTQDPTMFPTMLTQDPTMFPTMLTQEPTMSPTIVTEEPTVTATPEPTMSPTIITEGPTVSDTAEETAVVFTYQSEAGVCGGPPNGIGCANENPEDPPAGNPNDIVNCYNTEQFGVPIPFSINAVRVWIGNSATLAPDLQVNIWVGDEGSGGPLVDRLLYTEEIFDFNFGENTFELSMGRRIFQQNFCVGVTSRSTNAGLRVMYDEGGFGESSYLRSPECGIADFISLFEAGLENDFCIEALVTFPATF